ncbi:MAG: glycosyltransferase 61 family protein [Gammaproteobacteria bacterium]
MFLKLQKVKNKLRKVKNKFLIINNNAFTSLNYDNNIFHFFVFDIVPSYHPDMIIDKIYLNKAKHNNSNTSQWKIFVLKKLFNNAEIIYINFEKQQQKASLGHYNCWEFIKYKKDDRYIDLVNKIRGNNKGSYILFNQRTYNDRSVFDDKTENLLENHLQENLDIPFKFCNFATMAPEEQYDICNSALIFISLHGAGCTNLIFTPTECPLIEISFRTNWYCWDEEDRCCDDHFYGTVGINDKCNGILAKPYHKADYHNLCHLIGKEFIEIEPVRYKGKFNSRNPISKQQVYIDGEKLIDIINTTYKKLLK